MPWESFVSFRPLAGGLSFYQDYVQAAFTYQLAVKQSHKPIERLRLLKFSAESHARAGAPDAVSAVVSQMKAEMPESGNAKAIVLDTLQSLAKIASDNDVLVALMECIVGLDPSDTSTRFDLAYKHSEIGNYDLALFHYLTIPLPERTSSTWNNIGVACHHFDLLDKSITAYRRAKETGHTLAMSNLARNFIDAGFLPEAERECTDALNQVDYDKAITTTLTTLKNIPEDEQEKEKQVLQKTKERREFYRSFGEAMLRTESHEIPTYWKGADCILEATIHGSEFVALGSYERQSLNALASAFTPSNRPTLDHYRIEYRGTWVWGSAIRGSVTRIREGDSPAILSLSGLPVKSNVLMCLTEDHTEIHVMEAVTAANAKFYSLTKTDGT